MRTLMIHRTILNDNQIALRIKIVYRFDNGF